MAREIILAEPHGFCSGVRHALDVARKAVETSARPVYCLHEIVHNGLVVESLAAAGMVFVKDLAEVPDGGTVLFSAHGVAPAVRRAAEARGLMVIDATCVFVKLVHEAVRRHAAEGRHVLLVGNRDHDEVVGVAGEAPGAVTVVETVADAEAVAVPDPERVALATQTTLAAYQVRPIVEVLQRRFPALRIPDKSGICAATTVRQKAVRKVAQTCPLVLVLGSRNSANSNRLVDVARAAGARAELIPDIPSLRAFIASDGLGNAARVGVSAGASTPEPVVREALDLLRGLGADHA
ncbi:MAG: 4-hydroxy-3-methylbut-2-enyl diphosphate reductase [Kiritimatiellae bacterium]|nr:4-hydroxy-3-methylbut-2-enyl diphosphate reductase [Kiritimatiellia bacterium]